jgi:hypothetical protein
MSDQKQKSEAYQSLRSAFDELEVDEKALFLVEAAMSMVAHGAREAGNVVSKVVDDIVDNIKTESEDGDPEEDGSKGDASAENEEPAPKAAPRKRASRKKAPDPDPEEKA